MTYVFAHGCVFVLLYVNALYDKVVILLPIVQKAISLIQD